MLLVARRLKPARVRTNEPCTDGTRIDRELHYELA